MHAKSAATLGRESLKKHRAKVRAEAKRLREDVADMIAHRLFMNGAGQRAQRLVLELVGGGDGGGWCKRAVRDLVLDVLERNEVGEE